ncbi:hypothetical protein LWC35_37185 [Pseudonocardia kujensis]|uniref:hypothetical protein n=1 Tax=Pseudonocardia kujensis TaxID=1128675 RepID=UPI001E532BEE|nr:hypothetical protein [Pseudonocardia kujensis]MCE0768488.1 hypothetical protein [Pseudonocardia kujensis]
MQAYLGHQRIESTLRHDRARKARAGRAARILVNVISGPHRRRPARENLAMIRIELRTLAHDMLIGALATLAEEHSGPSPQVTKARWEGQEARNSAVMLSRIVELPAVPRPDDEIYASPYTEPLIVEEVQWTTDPADGAPQVTLFCSAVDLDVLADDAEEALETFAEGGWVVER